jgi:hypothetical protein
MAPPQLRNIWDSLAQREAQKLLAIGNATLFVAHVKLTCPKLQEQWNN